MGQGSQQAVLQDMDHSALRQGWCTAHTSAQEGGHLQCSDGTVLTDTMRFANAIVDQLAKQAAESIAMTNAARANVKRRFGQAKELAIFVGQLTFQAGHCDRGDGKPTHDSVRIDAASAQHRKKAKCRKVKPAPMTLEERSDTVASILRRIRSKWADTKVAPPSAEPGE